MVWTAGGEQRAAEHASAVRHGRADQRRCSAAGARQERTQSPACQPRAKKAQVRRVGKSPRSPIAAASCASRPRCGTGVRVCPCADTSQARKHRDRTPRNGRWSPGRMNGRRAVTFWPPATCVTSALVQNTSVPFFIHAQARTTFVNASLLYSSSSLVGLKINYRPG